jgi:hypothetical protein
MQSCEMEAKASILTLIQVSHTLHLRGHGYGLSAFLARLCDLFKDLLLSGRSSSAGLVSCQ